MTEHTPGPWATAAGDFAGDPMRDDEIAIIKEDSQCVIGSAFPFGDDEIGVSTQNANARLIASAPALLAALDAVMSVAADETLCETAECRRCIAYAESRAAIAAARGA